MNKRQIEFVMACQNLLESSEGRTVLAHLKAAYIDTSSIDPKSVERTYYNLGKKELVQELLDCANDPRMIDTLSRDIKYSNYTEDKE